MSAESAAETDAGYVDAEDCAEWRERAVDGDLCKDIASETSFHRSTVNKHVRGRDGCGHDALDGHPDSVPHTDGPGVHALADAASTARVREAIHERLDSTLGDTCYFSAGQLVADHDLDLVGQHASAVLRALADNGGELIVERTNPGANQARWMVTRASGEQVVTDGGEPSGAIDNTFDDAERDAREQLAESAAEHVRDLSAGDIAIDLVTRQPLFVVGVSAETLPAYYDREGFDLLNYKSHPYLPVRMDDRVLECVFVPRKVEGVHNTGKTYDYPAGRLARVPIERAGGDEQ